jgi:tRNA threonylcarbamoyladenosine biosynthesis protein TsaE
VVNEYCGDRLKLFHLDLYRLETREEMLSSGVEEFLQPDGVAVIEWAERLKPEAGSRKSEDKWVFVKIEILDESERKIVYDDFGA